MGKGETIQDHMVRSGVSLWELDTTAQKLTLSEDFAARVGIDGTETTIEKLRKHVPQEYIDLLNKQKIGQNEHHVPIKINGEIIWFTYYITNEYVDENGHGHQCGVARQMTDEEIMRVSETSGISSEEVSDLVKSLSLMLGEDTFEMGVHKILESVNTQINSMTTVVLQWNDDDEFECIDIVGGKVALPGQDKELAPRGHIYSQMLNDVCEMGIDLVANNINELDQYETAVSFFEDNKIGSVIFTPIRKGNGVSWGVMGIARRRVTQWSQFDLTWASLLSRAISLCLTHTLKSQRYKEQLSLVSFACRNTGISTWKWNCVTAQCEISLYKESTVSNIRVDLDEVLQRVTPQDQKRIKEQCDEILDGKAKEVRVRVRLRNFSQEKTKWYEFHGRVVENKRGEAVSVVGLTRDVDIEERHSQEVRRRAERQSDIFNRLPVGISFFDVNGESLYFNRTVHDIFGLPRKLTSVNIFKDPNFTEEQLDEIRNNEHCIFNINYDFSLVRHLYESTNKEIKNISIRISKFYSRGELRGYMTVSIDETQKIMQHQRLVEFDLYMKEIGSFAHMGFCFYGNKRGFATEQWNLNLDLPADIEYSPDIDYFINICDEDRQQLNHRLEELANEEIDSFQIDVRLKTLANVSRCIRLHFARNVFSNDISSISMDITQSKENERMLQDARRKAEQADALKSQFVANISHELRTPMNAIVGFSDLLIQTDEVDERQKIAEIIHANSDLLLQLVTDILDLSRVESGNIDLQYEAVDTNDLCECIYESMRMKTPRNVNFIYDGNCEGSGNITSLMDRRRVTQVVTNFVGNAFKFTVKGDVRLWYQIDNDMIHFHVTDTGKGIPQNQQKHVFEAFVKLDAFAVGTGLGLAICRILAQKMGGKVQMESKEGHGSHFWLSVPILHDENEVMEKYIKPQRTPLLVLTNDSDTDLFIETALQDNFQIYQADIDNILDEWIDKKAKVAVLDARTSSEAVLEVIECMNNTLGKHKIFVITDSQTTVPDEVFITMGAYRTLTFPMSQDDFVQMVSEEE